MHVSTFLHHHSPDQSKPKIHQLLSLSRTTPSTLPCHTPHRKKERGGLLTSRNSRTTKSFPTTSPFSFQSSKQKGQRGFLPLIWPDRPCGYGYRNLLNPRIRRWIASVSSKANTHHIMKGNKNRKAKRKRRNLARVFLSSLSLAASKKDSGEKEKKRIGRPPPLSCTLQEVLSAAL